MTLSHPTTWRMLPNVAVDTGWDIDAKVDRRMGHQREINNWGRDEE